jgi:hypothetical protein
MWGSPTAGPRSACSPTARPRGSAGAARGAPKVPRRGPLRTYGASKQASDVSPLRERGTIASPSVPVGTRRSEGHWHSLTRATRRGMRSATIYGFHAIDAVTFPLWSCAVARLKSTVLRTEVAEPPVPVTGGSASAQLSRSGTSAGEQKLASDHLKPSWPDPTRTSGGLMSD